MSVITIARQFGAGGKTLGSAVAERLGYELIDEEIVELIAREANVSPDWVDLVARETGSEGMLSRMLLKLGPFRKGYVEVLLESNPGYIDGNLYITLLHRILPKIAAQDNVILIGRGSQYILADHPNSLHFLMIADLEFRIRFVMENYHLDRRQAQIVVAKQSKRRLNLYRYFGRTDYDQPDLYHVVFNMNKIKLEDAVETVCLMAESQASG
jgi:cytidylate kinase